MAPTPGRQTPGPLPISRAWAGLGSRNQREGERHHPDHEAGEHEPAEEDDHSELPERERWREVRLAVSQGNGADLTLQVAQPSDLSGISSRLIANDGVRAGSGGDQNGGNLAEHPHAVVGLDPQLVDPLAGVDQRGTGLELEAVSHGDQRHKDGHISTDGALSKGRRAGHEQA